MKPSSLELRACRPCRPMPTRSTSALVGEFEERDAPARALQLVALVAASGTTTGSGIG